MIAVHPKTGDNLKHKIRDMGYLFEKTDDSTSYPYYITPDDEAEGIEERVIGLDHPLLTDTFWPRPFRAALTVTGDIDCLTLGDFIRRFREG